MLKKIFKPKNLYKLLRLGRDNDGGYLVESVSISNSKTLISFGISTDWSFEEDFKKINNCPLFAYDYTLNKHFWSTRPQEEHLNFKSFFNKEKKNYFFPKKISKLGIKDHESFSIEVEDIFKSLEFNMYGGCAPYFFKIDIEGSEYRILESLLKISEDIQGIVIEFHDVDLHLSKIEHFIHNINLELCHIHPNNACNVTKDGIPLVLELTFSKNPILINEKINFPHVLDQKNIIFHKDIELKFIE